MRLPARFRTFLKVLAIVFGIGAIAITALVFWPANQPHRLALRQQLIDRMGPSVQTKALTVHGATTTYLEAGADQSGPPLVLLHGGGEGAVTWYPVLAALAARRHVIAPDVIGYGESDKPTGAYDADFFSAWLIGFLDAQGLRSVNLVGSSQGGAIALHFAAAHPDRVRRLIVADPAGVAPTPPLILAHFFLLNSIPTNALAQPALSYLVASPDRVDPAWLAYGVEELRLPGAKRVFWDGRGAIVNPISSGELAKVNVPTLVLWGDRDTFYPPSYAATLKKELAAATLTLLTDAGHLPFFDQPAAFSNAVLAFVATP